jgi:hypothetical protein
MTAGFRFGAWPHPLRRHMMPPMPTVRPLQVPDDDGPDPLVSSDMDLEERSRGYARARHIAIMENDAR